MRAHPSRFLLLTIAYAATGWLALRLAVPPGYAVPVFPPAGIALSALLIFGLRMWPAIFLGSLLIQVAAMAGSPPTLPALLSGLVVACGVSVQAMAGATFTRRLIGYPDPLDSPSAIVRFIVLVAPLSSLVAPCIAIPALYAAGRIPASELAFNWWNWWVGDTLGVLLAAPLMFVFFGQPADYWRSRRLGVAVPLSLAMLVLATGFHQMLAWEDARVHSEFDRDASQLATKFGRRLAVQLGADGMLEQAERPCGVLSYGDLKRVELAVALANHPRLLLMDEPAAGLAPAERDALMRLATSLAREQRVAVLFTEHDMDVVFKHADRVIVLADGELIADGAPQAVRADARVREIYLGADDA